jgi:hypothetical protein
VQKLGGAECADAEIVRAVEASIRERTWGRVCRLRVELQGELVIVCGGALTFHVKQLAAEAARKALPMTRTLRIDIDVP